MPTSMICLLSVEHSNCGYVFHPNIDGTLNVLVNKPVLRSLPEKLYFYLDFGIWSYFDFHMGDQYHVW